MNKKLNRGNNIGLWVGAALIAIGVVVAIASGQAFSLLFLL